VASEKIFGNRFVMVGNATEFLDPIFSSGVMFASVSSNLAATLVIRELKGEKVNWKEAYSDYLNAGIAVFRSYVNAWYDGTLEKIFFAKDPDPEIQKQICSVLAGYDRDLENPYVKEHHSILAQLVKKIEFREKKHLQ
jgi:flavin-dependent dehydrogenase